jgi:transcriptional regulator
MTPKQKRVAEKKRIEDIERRYLDKNTEAMSFCLKNGFTVYATAQAVYHNKVKVFKQRGEKFLAVSEKLFDQNEIEDIKEYCALIDKVYEETYLKMKDRL